ncbi:MAG: hypothetical protein ACD_28C00113G0010 [uncultured bacterium]|nr:MAG: hypothetical protein ACD_28C00113G0010 [uncultured bacterium]KKT74838.1 MAG: hypothetical protein UW70_C0044G0008 [Candidatus Peregrinibacteria bacterium GW2011_GWA2_44_7]
MQLPDDSAEPTDSVFSPSEIISRLPDILAAYAALYVGSFFGSTKPLGLTLDDYLNFGKSIGAIKSFVQILTAYVDSGIPYDPNDVIRYVEKIENGLRFAEQRGIVFEDPLKHDLNELSYMALCRAGKEAQRQALAVLDKESVATSKRDLLNFLFVAGNLKYYSKSGVETAFQSIGRVMPSDLEQSFEQFHHELEAVIRTAESRLGLVMKNIF